MINRVHNLPIEDLLDKLEQMYERGYTHVDAIFLTDFDISFRPSNFKKEPRQEEDSDEPRFLENPDINSFI